MSVARRVSTTAFLIPSWANEVTRSRLRAFWITNKINGNNTNVNAISTNRSKERGANPLAVLDMLYTLNREISTQDTKIVLQRRSKDSKSP